VYPDPFVVHFLSLLPSPQGSTVLDAGCGAGRNARYLAGAGLRVTAIDRSVGMVRRARAEGVPAGIATIEHLPFVAGAFDAAVCTSVLEYLDAPTAQAAVAEVQRVLRPGGRLLVVAAAAEGSEPGYGAGRHDATVARLTERDDLTAWFDQCDTLERLHVHLEVPASPPVRAQWVLIARRR